MADSTTTTAPVTPAAPAAAATPNTAAPDAKASAPAVSGTKETAKSAENTAATTAKVAEKKMEEAKQEMRRLKLKIDGAEHDLSEEEVLALAQQSAGAAKRFQEAASTRKQAEDVIAFIKSNPGEALKRLGVDPRKFSEEFLVDALKKEAESPDQKKIREAEEKIRSYEAKEKQMKDAEEKRAAEAKAETEKAAQEARTKEIQDRYDRVFTEALDKSGCEKNAYTIKRMAELQRINLKKKLDLGPDSLAKLVKEDVEREVTHHVKDRSGDQLIEFLGPELIKRITKAQIAKLKGAPQKFTTGVTPPAVDNANDPNKPKSWREFTRRGRRALT